MSKISKITPASKPVANPNALLAERAMCVQFTVRSWSGTKLDRDVTDSVNASHNAATDAGRYMKSLVCKQSLAAIVKAFGAARTYHYSKTLAGFDDGSRLLPTASFADYTQMMKALKADFDSAVSVFVADYGKNMESAKIRLGTMFKAGDYPAVEEVEARFSMGLNVLPIPNAAAFRTNLSEEQMSAVRANVERQVTKTVAAVNTQCIERMVDVIGKVAAKLRDYKPGTDTERAKSTFRDSLMSNLQDLVQELPALNITENPAITRLTEEIDFKLSGYAPSDLRDNDKLRNDVALKAEALHAQALALLG
jgi:hypothetical protein